MPLPLPLLLVVSQATVLDALQLQPAPAVTKKGRNRPVPVVTKFKVTVPANVVPGIYDVRLFNKWGVSNPRAFVVGDLADVLEKEPNNDVKEAQRVELNTTSLWPTTVIVSATAATFRENSRSCVTPSVNVRLFLISVVKPVSEAVT